jgi:hypothetical protein
MPLEHDGDALVVAVNRNKVDIVRLLLEHGSNVSLHEGVNGRMIQGNAAVQASSLISAPKSRRIAVLSTRPACAANSSARLPFNSAALLTNIDMMSGDYRVQIVGVCQTRI